MKQPLFFKIYRDGKVLEIKQFSKAQVVLGREGEVDVQLSDASVSPIHAIIEERQENKFFICDLGSQTGTTLNGNKVVDEAIKDGDAVAIGPFTVEFSVGVPKPKAASAAPSAPKPAQKPPKVDEIESDPVYTRVEVVRPPDAPPSKPLASPPKDVPKKPTPPPQPQASTAASFSSSKVNNQAKSTISHSSSGAGLGMNPPSKNSTSYPSSGKGTFAPPSKHKSLKETIKPGRGGVVEIAVGWHDRVLNTYHFEQRQVIHVGSHPKNEIVLPAIGSARVSHPLIKVDGATQIFLTTDMSGTVNRENNVSLTFEDLKRQGSIVQSGGGFAYTLQQNEVVQINLGEGISLWIRFVGNSPPVVLAPLLDLTLNQVTGLIIGLLAVGLLSIYIFLYSPELPEKQEDETDPPRKAQFIYKHSEKAIEAEETQKSSVKSQDKSQTKSAETQSVKDKELAPSRNEEGAASEAAPNKSKSKEKKLTSTKAGKDTGIKKGSGATKPDAAAAATQKDVKNSGLLGTFGKSGIQDQLNRANQGTGFAGGAAKAASGAGSETAGSGINAGNGMRELGQGGNGTATVGIAGLKTTGKGGGVSGYGTGAIGGKKNASIIAGGDDATFTGTIDREAIRRVVQAHIKEIKGCYERALNKDPGLYGKIVIQWTIGSGGRVLEASTKSTTMNSPEVENCAVSRLKTWKFPEPPADQVAVVSYPFVFQAQE